MIPDKTQRLAGEAIRLKKAWLCLIGLLGKPANVSEEYLQIANYAAWENKKLKAHIKDLEDDVADLAKRALLDWKRSNFSPTVAWLSQAYDHWESAGFQLFDLGRVQEVERAIGRLGHRRRIECPPYAQVLLQAHFGAGIRHPEYHLAQDLALLYSLFLDSEAILVDALRRRQRRSSEYSQSLARSVIITCFNLLESFVSGLAVGWMMENPNAPATIVAKLQDTRSSLRKRLVQFPSIITGRPGLIDDSCPPIASLFGEHKQRRDSFVHCQPGSGPNQWGYVKEERFHDVQAATVRKTVDLTIESICLIWKAVHGREHPRWLPRKTADGRFERVGVKLTAIEETRS
jgi:hypothetical protein